MIHNRSVATIDAPEFINVTPYNPLISQCEIKVFYLGENRNHSYITKDVAIQMANSLPGTPIVGAWREDIEDFGDHGHVITIEDNEIKFACKTRPYGFVAPDAPIWFQKFIDTDEFGNEIEREYLMTVGYLWTGQYAEAMKAVQEGQAQSMELDEASLDGHWATNSKSGIEFFIINDAVFSKLCILGDNVEPCFEGASVTKPEVSKNFTTDKEFGYTLYTMMEELKDALSQNGGRLNMPENIKEYEADGDDSLFGEGGEEGAEETTENTEEEPGEGFVGLGLTSNGSEGSNGEEGAEEEQDPPAGGLLGLTNNGEEGGSGGSGDDNGDTPGDEITPVPADDDEIVDDEESKLRERFGFSREDYEALQKQVEEMQAELEELRAFKLDIINQRKDALIDRYHMLSLEDKRDIIQHKEEYTLEQIEAKLAILYVEKNVNFETVDGKEEVESNDTDPILTFSLDNETAETVPAFVEALRSNRK